MREIVSLICTIFNDYYFTFSRIYGFLLHIIQIFVDISLFLIYLLILFLYKKKYHWFRATLWSQLNVCYFHFSSMIHKHVKNKFHSTLLSKNNVHICEKQKYKIIFGTCALSPPFIWLLFTRFMLIYQVYYSICVVVFGLSQFHVYFDDLRFIEQHKKLLFFSFIQMRNQQTTLESPSKLIAQYAE